MTHFGKHLVKQPQNNCHNCHNMNQIKNLAFDLGGVVLALSYENAIARFEEIGLKDARKHLDAFCQQGIFGDLEIDEPFIPCCSSRSRSRARVWCPSTSP